jgi:hypothetical protein
MFVPNHDVSMIIPWVQRAFHSFGHVDGSPGFAWYSSNILPAISKGSQLNVTATNLAGSVLEALIHLCIVPLCTIWSYPN